MRLVYRHDRHQVYSVSPIEKQRGKFDTYPLLHFQNCACAPSIAKQQHDREVQTECKMASPLQQLTLSPPLRYTPCIPRQHRLFDIPAVCRPPCQQPQRRLPLTPPLTLPLS